ncbi:MAG: hypothetical protein JNJ59_17450 [Deltaproteobacteria bacterium]|nr:hypothetical protein [Deltaproteobacteria bacterium]
MLAVIDSLRRFQVRLARAFALPEDRVPTWLFALLLVAIVVFGAALRSAWYLTSEVPPSYFWKGELILTSPDGYYFATGVGHTLSDAWGDGMRLPIAPYHALVALTAGLIKVFGFSPGTLYTWLPVVLGPLVALPMALYGRFQRRSWFGLVAALFAVAVPTYAYRTFIGYFDTDVFTLTVPLLAVIYLVRVLEAAPPASDPASPAKPIDPAASRSRALLTGALILSLYTFFYDQGVSIAQVTGLVTALALAALAWLDHHPIAARSLPAAAHPKKKKKGPAPRPAATPSIPSLTLPAAPQAATLATVLAFANLPVFWAFRPFAVVLARLGLPRLPLGPRLRAGLAVVVTLGVFFGAMTPQRVSRKVDIYAGAQAPQEADLAPAASGVPLDKPAPSDPTAQASWTDKDTTGLVAEAKVLSLGTMGRNAAGHLVLLVLGLLGFLALYVSRPSLTPALPLLAVGLFSFFGGQRFLIYLVPFLGWGLAWLALTLGRLVSRAVGRLAGRDGLLAGVVIGASTAVPGSLVVLAVVPPTTLHTDEIDTLERLAKQTTPDDMTVAWWDYGYPLMYHAHTRTLTNGSLRGDDASLAAEILLTKDPELARRLSLLAVDALDHSPGWGAARYLIKAAQAKAMSPQQFLDTVGAGLWPVPPAKSDVFIYLPLRFLSVLPALDAYRMASPGVTRRVPFLRVLRAEKSVGSKLYLEGDVQVDADAVAILGPEVDGARPKIPLSTLWVVTGGGAALKKHSRQGDPKAPVAGVFLRDNALFLELDPRLLETTWASLFLFESADPTRFELVLSTEAAKVYKVRPLP